MKLRDENEPGWGWIKNRLADPIKAVKVGSKEYKRGGWSDTHTSMGTTTYLLIRNRHFGIEKRRLWGVRIGRVRVGEGN
jgi:hypothetical protein